jgi:hypothetical protein
MFAKRYAAVMPPWRGVVVTCGSGRDFGLAAVPSGALIV